MDASVFSNRLVDYLVLVGPGRGVVFEKSLSESGDTMSFGSSLGGLTTGSWHKVSHPQPTILRKFPALHHKDFELASDIAYFCQPEGCCTNITEPQTHIFLLTDTETNVRTYGVCLSLPHLFDPLLKAQDHGEEQCGLTDSNSLCIQEWGILSVCILSRHPFFTFFKKCLNTLAHFVEHFCGTDLTWNALIEAQYWPNSSQYPAVEEVEHWVEQLLTLRAPVPGESALEVELEVDPAVVVSYPPSSRLPLLELSVHRVFRRLGVCNVIDIYKLVLSEQKVILHSTDCAYVSECVLTIVNLLYPLQYLFPVIPLLPTSMPTAENLLMVPTPFFIGVCSSFLSKLEEFHHSEVWMINLDSGEFQPPEQLDQPVLEFPYCILQLQADIRRVLDKLDRVYTLQEVHAMEANMYESFLSLSPEDQQQSLGDEVDVMIRISFVDFLFSPEVLGNIDQYLCIFRLFPRPVVTLRTTAFLSDYEKVSPATSKEFIRELMRSQGIEYFFEWSLNPNNFAFEEIRKGVREVERLSDKQTNYIHRSGMSVEQICIYDLNDESLLYQEMLAYKASQASYQLVAGYDLPDNDSDWFKLTHDFNDGSSDIATSTRSATPSYYSGDSPSEFPLLVNRRLIISSGMEGDVVEAGFIEIIRDDQEDGESDFYSPKYGKRGHSSTSFKFPTIAVDRDSSPDESIPSPTDNAEHSSQKRHLLHVSNLGGKLSVSCEALPISDVSGEEEGGRESDTETQRSSKFYTPRSINDTDFPRARITPRVRQRKYSTDDTIVVTRRTLSGPSELRQSWLSPRMFSQAETLTEVVQFSTAFSSLRRSSSLQLRAEREVTPPVSRTIPFSAVTKSQVQEFQLQDLVMKIMEGQGLPWPKPPGLRKLAATEKSRVTALRLLEVKLGLRKPNEMVKASSLQMDPVGVAKSVYRSVVDLLKYFIQCIEEELQRDTETSIFSAFLILRISLSIYLLPRRTPTSTTVTKEEVEAASALFSSSTITQHLHPESLKAGESVRISPRKLSDNSTAEVSPQKDLKVSQAENSDPNYVAMTEEIPEMTGDERGTAVIGSPDFATPVQSPSRDKSPAPTPSLAGYTGSTSPTYTVESVESRGSDDTDQETATQSDTRSTHLLSPSSGEETAPQQQFSTPLSRTPVSAPYYDVEYGSQLPPWRSLKHMRSRDSKFVFPITSRSPKLLEAMRGSDKKIYRFAHKDLMKVLGTARSFMLNRQFWTVLFMSTIDAERSFMGWNERTPELYERYNSLSESHRHAFSLEEDTLLSVALHSLLMFMLVVGLSPQETTDITYRFMARTRLASTEEKLLQQTLKHVEQNVNKATGEVDLSNVVLLALYSEVHPTISYIVHYGINMIAPVYKLQITNEALILRRFPDEKISSRLWNNCISDLSYNSRRATVSIRYRDSQGEYSHHFHTKQFTKVFESLQIIIYGSDVSS